MVSHSKRTGKDGAGLAILSLAVTEEEGVARRVVVAQFAGLSYKAAVEHYTIVDMRTTGDDEVIADDPVTDIDRCLLTTVDTAVGQATDTRDGSIITHTHILDGAAIYNSDMSSEGSTISGMLVAIIVGNLLHPCRQLRTVAIESHDISLMRREFIVDGHFTPARFIQHSHLYPIAKTGETIHQQHIHMLNARMSTDIVVGNVVLHMLNAAVITYSDIMECGMTDSCMLLHASRQGEGFVHLTETYLAAEVYMMNVIGPERFSYPNLVPILCRAHLCFQLLQFSLIQSSVVHLFSG